MFNEMLIALLLVATVDIQWAESAHNRGLLLNRNRRDEQSKLVNYGPLSGHYQNNYPFDGKLGNGDASQNPSIIAGSLTNQDKNSHSNVGQAVYIVLPHAYTILNQQTPSAVHGSLGTHLTQQRRQEVREKINQLKGNCTELFDAINHMTARNQGLDHKSEDLEESNKSLILLIMYHECQSLKERLKYQELRLRQFNDETLPMEDTFDEDLAHLKNMLELAKSELISLDAS